MHMHACLHGVAHAHNNLLELINLIIIRSDANANMAVGPSPRHRRLASVRGGASAKEDAIDSELYSRQLYVLGRAAQRSLATSTILLVGLTGARAPPPPCSCTHTAARVGPRACRRPFSQVSARRWPRTSSSPASPRWTCTTRRSRRGRTCRQASCCNRRTLAPHGTAAPSSASRRSTRMCACAPSTVPSSTSAPR